MAMKGKNCVAIAADRRFGIQAQMTVDQRLKFRLNPYELKEGRQIKPYTLMSMVANLLYEKRFGPYYTEPVIAGLDPKTFKPFICSLDLIGCPMVTDDFVVSEETPPFLGKRPRISSQSYTPSSSGSRAPCAGHAAACHRLSIFANMLGVSLFLLAVLCHYMAVNNPEKQE
ncbi:hypothetical protein Celaphus_00012946 [Cervus elaphus hippelaphus]|uniref:Uncharacterized protein n=1 Tax=Cervus elaphus hippelaphus TaxID=46360 RepID=A0A212CK41_CEREH|nr:hypothetical protein Celaphus_00012946 [Cervus elaphus hippelaphus]